MSEIKHSPGPWKLVGPDRDDPHRVHVSSSGNWYRFASVVVRMIGEVKDEPIGLANARLIAAAPDLLAAAKIVLAGLNQRIDAAPIDAVPVFDGIAELHSAVAKAERFTDG